MYCELLCPTASVQRPMKVLYIASAALHGKQHIRDVDSKHINFGIRYLLRRVSDIIICVNNIHKTWQMPDIYNKSDQVTKRCLNS